MKWYFRFNTQLYWKRAGFDIFFRLGFSKNISAGVKSYVDLKKIKALVGDVEREQLRYVDCFVGENIGVFMPVCGACFYALTPEHTHPSYMFVLYFNGLNVVDIGGRKIRSEPGKYLALSPGIPHQELPSETPPRYLVVLINPFFFEKRLGVYGKRKFLFKGEICRPGPELLPLLRRFMAEADGKLPGRGEVLPALETEICHSLIRSAIQVQSPGDFISLRMEIDRAVEFIHLKLGEKITLKQMARTAGMSESNFTRVFHKETGLSPLAYLSRTRLEKARKLLAADLRPITEIALECGFGNPGYFSERFLKKFGITPSEYRAGLRKGRIPEKKGRKSEAPPLKSPA